MLGSIRHRLVLLVLLVALPLVAATSLVIYRFAQTQIAAQRDALLASTRTLATAVDGELEKYIAVGKSLGTASSLREGDLAEFYRRARATMEYVPDSWLVLVDRGGQQLINTSQPFGAPLPMIRDRVTHELAMNTGQPQISHIYVGAVTGRHAVNVHVPVVRNKETAYNLIIAVDPKNFLAILLRQQMPPGWLSGITDRNGNLVARSLDHDRRVGAPASAGLRAAARERAEGSFENVSLEGEPLFSAFRNSALSGWSISLGAPQRALTAPLYRSLRIISLLAGTLIAISIFLAWLVSRRIAASMQALETAAGSLLSGAPANVGRTGLKEIDRALEAFEASTHALLERESQFRSLANSIPQLAWMADANGWIFWYNRRWFDYTGSTLADMQGWGWRSVQHPEHVERVTEHFKACLETGENWEDTFPLRGKDGEYRWFLSRALPIRDAAGNIVRWFGTNTDVSDQKETEERQRLLVNELNHRVKNTLAVIQSIASVTSRSAVSAAQFSKSFIARLLRIARTHDLLTESHWEGAPLGDVVLNELSPYQGEGAQRVSLRGPYVRLPPRTALALGMVMHEMATNAAKYGALSTADGKLSVSWDIDRTGEQPTLRLEWVESGGPQVKEPEQQGFGSRLISLTIGRDLQGSAEMDYHGDGLRCTITFPLEAESRAAEAA